MEPSDAELWTRARTGDRDAFGELFERHATPIYNYCFRRVGSWATAEDLLSLVFLEAWRRRDKKLPPDKVLPWLYGIATNVVRNQRRSERRFAAALQRAARRPARAGLRRERGRAARRRVAGAGGDRPSAEAAEARPGRARALRRDGAELRGRGARARRPDRHRALAPVARPSAMNDTISFPPLRELPPARLEARRRHLLAEIAHEPERRASWRGAVTAVVAVVALAGAGVAIADGFGAFDGISAAQHRPTAADELDPSVLASIAASGNLLGLEPDSARFVTQLASGVRIYAIATKTGGLCALAERLPNNDAKSDAAAMGCGSPLSESQPTTTASFRANDSTPPISYGIALDGVTAVSFTADGQDVTVPVKNNVWAYEGDVSGVGSITVHFADGSTETTG